MDNSAKIEAISQQLGCVMQDLGIIRRLAREVFDAGSIQAAADIASSIEALATRAGRAVDQCSQAAGQVPFGGWDDYPFLAKTTEAA